MWLSLLKASHSGSAMTSMLQCRQPCLCWPTPWHCLRLLSAHAPVHCLVTTCKGASASQHRVTKRSSHSKLFSIALGCNRQQLMIASKGCARQIISKASSNALYTSHPSSSAIVWLLLQNPAGCQACGHRSNCISLCLMPVPSACKNIADSQASFLSNVVTVEALLNYSI